MPRRVAAESESEAEAATEKDPGHVAMGEEDTLEAFMSAVSGAYDRACQQCACARTSWFRVHAPLGAI